MNSEKDRFREGQERDGLHPNISGSFSMTPTFGKVRLYLFRPLEELEIRQGGSPALVTNLRSENARSLFAAAVGRATPHRNAPRGGYAGHEEVERRGVHREHRE